jgi:cytochrome bd-type quinol oxidase subunit 2
VIRKVLANWPLTGTKYYSPYWESNPQPEHSATGFPSLYSRTKHASFLTFSRCIAATFLSFWGWHHNNLEECLFFFSWHPFCFIFYLTAFLHCWEMSLVKPFLSLKSFIFTTILKSCTILGQKMLHYPYVYIETIKVVADIQINIM